MVFFENRPAFIRTNNVGMTHIPGRINILLQDSGGAPVINSSRIDGGEVPFDSTQAPKPPLQMDC